MDAPYLNNLTLDYSAEQYAALGWKLVPLHGIERGQCTCGRPECAIKPGKPTSAGKHPRLNEWQKHATDDLDQVRAWWRQWPNANIGVRTGSKSGFVAIDIDPPGGEEALLEHSGGDLPPTVESRTGKGRRLFYAIPENCEVEPRTVPFKDANGRETIRMQGGNTGAQCVLPPSMHYLGHKYQWAPGRSPLEIGLAPMPSWVWVEMCRPEKPPPAADRRGDRDPDAPWSEFNRADSWDAWLLLWGYKPAGRGQGDVRYYTRPGKDGGISVSVGHVKALDGTPALWVFSGNCPDLPADKSYDLAGAWTRIMHRGDFTEAGKSLFTMGYGKKRVPHLQERVAALEAERAHLLERVAKLEEQTRWLYNEVRRQGEAPPAHG